MRFYLTLLIFAILNPKPGSGASVVRISTVQPQITVIAGTQNFAAILVEGQAPEACELAILEGPGQVGFDKSVHRWLWEWQPTIADTGRDLPITVQDMRSKVKHSFSVRVNVYKMEWNNLRKSPMEFYSGIPTTYRVKQPGLDGEYSVSLTFSDSLAGVANEPVLTVRPDLHGSVGKLAKLVVNYTAPLTGKQTTLTSYQRKVKYPEFRVMPYMELKIGEPAFFRGALGYQPNFFIPLPGRILLVRSNGYFEDTARMVTPSMFGRDDPFGLLSIELKREPGKSVEPSFYFVLRQTEKGKAITDKRGQMVPVTLYDPITKQENEITALIYPLEEGAGK